MEVSKKGKGLLLWDLCQPKQHLRLEFAGLISCRYLRLADGTISAVEIAHDASRLHKQAR